MRNLRRARSGDVPDGERGIGRLDGGQGLGNITVDKVSVRFGDFLALNELSCTFTPGIVNGLIGPNGAGKSTLLNAITGVVRLESGEIRLNNDCLLSGLRPERVAALGVGRTFQIPRLFRRLSVLDNVVVAVAAQQRDSRNGLFWPPGLPSSALTRARAVASGWLERLDAGDIARKAAANLTLPEQRLVELVRVLVHSPRLLLLDEPSSGLGVEQTQRLLQLSVSFLPKTSTILLVSHDVQMVFDLAKHVVVLDRGELVAQGNVDVVASEAVVQEVYLGKPA